MDYLHLMTLIASLPGNPPATGFAELRASAAAPGSALTLHDCVQPIDYDEIEGETVICGTLSVRENHNVSTGCLVGLEFAVSGSHRGENRIEFDELLGIGAGAARGERGVQGRLRRIEVRDDETGASPAPASLAK